MPPQNPPLFEVNETGSTNTLARERLAQKLAAPADNLIVVAARRQTAGRGRLGRAWASPEGGVWLSIAGALPHASNIPARSLAAAVAAAETAERALDGARSVRIRWPNDLLIGGNKLGGLLGESITIAGRPALILGVGINVNNATDTGETPFRTPPTSLSAEAGRAIDLPRFRDALIAALTDAWRTFDRLGLDAHTRDRLNARLADRGEIVRLTAGPRAHEGTLLGVDDDGALRLEIEGEPRRFASGELSCRPGERPGSHGS